MRLISKIFLLFFLTTISFHFAQESDIRVMTYNIRYASENTGEEWSLRKENIAEMIRFHNPDIFGLQEVLKVQTEFLEEVFPEYSWIGVGRDDGKSEGEYSPIYFNKKFELLAFETLWLSPTPDIPSIGWDAALKRIVTKVILLDKKKLDTLEIYNTHFDHIGIVAREKSAEFLTQKLDQSSKNSAIILMGDFNVTDTSKAYKIINHSFLTDAQDKSINTNYGTNISFNGFKNKLVPGRKIDHIFVNSKIEIIHHAVIGDKFNGKYPSDHMPVIIDIRIPTINSK